MSACNYCHTEPKRPGSGQRFCSDICQEAAKACRKKPSRKTVRLRAERRRRERGVKVRPKTWDDEGCRICPRCLQYVELNQFKNGYCLTCLPVRRREYSLKKKYGMTMEDYDRMVLDQEGRCAICLNETDQLHIDHCHATGRVRGLLCKKCNYQLLGLVNDDADLLRRAADYLVRL